MSGALLVAAAALAVLVSLAAAFPSGAPDSACSDLKPGHGAEPASGAAPFVLTQDKLQVEAGDQIKGKYRADSLSQTGAKSSSCCCCYYPSRAPTEESGGEFRAESDGAKTNTTGDAKLTRFETDDNENKSKKKKKKKKKLDVEVSAIDAPPSIC